MDLNWIGFTKHGEIRRKVVTWWKFWTSVTDWLTDEMKSWDAVASKNAWIMTLEECLIYDAINPPPWN